MTGTSRLRSLAPAAAPAWDRFAHWPRAQARVLLLALLVILAAAPFAAITSIRPGTPAAEMATMDSHGKAKKDTDDKGERTRDADLALYDHVITRLQKGESYYHFVVEQQRRENYPVAPGVAVRLPTLAYLIAWLGTRGAKFALLALLAGTMAAWWRRLGRDEALAPQRALVTALIFVGSSLCLNSFFNVVHEVWSGELMALAIALYVPARQRAERRWVLAWLAMAAALAIREHSLPLLLLFGASALWHRAWKEAAAWALLLALFLGGMAVHLHVVSQHVLGTDHAGDSWLTLRGLGGWLSTIVLSSQITRLPDWISGPLVILTMLCWGGWRTKLGEIGCLFFFGMAVAMMIVGRPDNFYWGFALVPVFFAPLPLLPKVVRSLARTAWGPAREAAPLALPESPATA